MKHRKSFLIVLCSMMLLTGITSCKKYLDDAFPNPNKPVEVDPDLVLPAVISNFARGVFFVKNGERTTGILV